jgi:WD40 repeat protein
VAWSPDGKRIASGGNDKLALGRDDRRTLQVWDALDGENAIACGKYPSLMHALAWSPDGRYIASNEGPQVQVWNAATGDPDIAYQAHLYNEAHDLILVIWSPDGTRLAASDQIGKIWVGAVDVLGTNNEDNLRKRETDKKSK